MTTAESFFSLLKSHRESKGVKIQEIAEYTKINPKYLHAIETGEFEVLPNAYMRLFLRSYAQFIGADAKQALDDYELHTTGRVSVKVDSIAEPSTEQTSNNSNRIETIFDNSPIPPKQIMTGIVVILSLFLFFNLVSSLSEQQSEIMPVVETEALPETTINKDQVEDKIEAISVNPTQVVNETNIPTSIIEDHTEPTEDVKKKP